MTALRSLIRTPLFTIAAIATLALGIGTNTAMFSVVNGVLLAPLRYPDADRVVVIPAQNPSRDEFESSATPVDLLEWREQAPSFEAIAGFQYDYYNLTKLRTPVQVTGGRTTEDFFKVHGVAPALGRTWEPRDCRVESPPVIVIGHSLWKDQLGGGASIIGKSVIVNDIPHEVIGVMPAGFRDLYGGEELWTPIPLNGPEAQIRGARSWTASGRLRPGVTVEGANAEIRTLTAAQEKARPDVNTGWTASVIPARNVLVKDVNRGLLLLWSASTCLLLLTAVNVAGLVLSRAQSRRREIGIRVALGSTRFDLFRLFLVEGLAIALAGGALGAFLAWLGIPLLTQFLPDWFPRTEEIAINGNVLVFTLAVSVAVGIIFALLPALTRDATADPARGLKSVGDDARSRRLRTALMVGEIALSLVLLSGAGLMFRSFLRIQSVPSGMRTQGLAAFVLNVSETRYPTREARAAYYHALLERVRATPGVAAASLSQTTPFTWGMPYEFEVSGHASPETVKANAYLDSIDAEYFATSGIGLRAGRVFSTRDVAGTPLVMIINEALARKYFGDENPIGQRIVLTQLKDTPTAEIVGVVGDVKRSGLTEATPLQLYLPYEQRAHVFSTIFYRAANGDAATAGKSVERAIWSVNPDQTIGRMLNMDTLAASSATVPRLRFVLLAVFSVLALVLAAVGLYGLIAYAVGTRTREIGIRMALGAQANHVFKLVVAEGARVVGFGIILGVLGTLALSELAAGIVFGVSPRDPVVLILVSMVLGAVGLIAAAIPARRATRIDPNVALRGE